MHRIDTPTAQIDKFGPGKNGFTNGDPATGRRATDLNSDMWDAVQEEMANAIEGNGIALDKSKHNQLYLAIQKAITDPGFLKKANNLSDVDNVPEARGNLGLGTAATKNVGTGREEIGINGTFGVGGDTPILPSANTLDVLKSKPTGKYAVNAPSSDMPSNSISYELDWSSTASGRYGVLIAKALVDKGNPNDKVYRKALRNGAWQDWVMFFDTVNKPTAVDTGALPITGGTLSGNLNVDGVDFINKRKYFEFNDGSANHRQTSGLHLLGAGDQYADILFDEVIGQYAALRVHTRSAGSDGWYEFRNDGTFNASGTVGAGGGNGSKLHPDGNIWGASWGGYLKDFLNNKTSRDEFQSGVNGNGAWTKFPGGGMWCRHNLNLIANGVTTWTFPASFPSTPGVYITAFNGEFKCWLNGAGPSNCSIYNAGPALNVNVFAIW